MLFDETDDLCINSAGNLEKGVLQIGSINTVVWKRILTVKLAN